MGRINNGNWVNQHRKIQGKFQNKQDIEAYLFDKKLSNGNNIQENNRLNTDDLPNIPAILDYETNLSRKSIIEPIDGGKAHTPTTQAFLSALTALSVISPNITASSKKTIPTDSQNSLSSTVKSFTEVSKTPILFNTTSATTPTSQNHDKLEELTKHNDNQSFIRVKRSKSSTEYVVSPHQEYACDATIDTKIITQKLQEGNIKTLFIRNLNKPMIEILMDVIKDNNISVLTLMHSELYSGPLSINASYIQEIAKALKGTKVEELFLVHNRNGDSTAINIIESIKKVDAKVKILNLSNNTISNQGAENIASKLRDTQITEVCLTKNKAIKPETLQKIFKVLEDNKDVHTISIEPHIATSTIEFSTTKEESSKDISGKQEKKEDLTTPKGNIIEKSEPIAEDIVTDSTTPTPQESNTNNPTSSTISIELSVGLKALAVSIIAAIGGTVVYLTKKFCDGEKSYTHDDLPLAKPTLDSHLDNNQDIPLTGVVVDEGI